MPKRTRFDELVARDGDPPVRQKVLRASQDQSLILLQLGLYRLSPTEGCKPRNRAGWKQEI